MKQVFRLKPFHQAEKPPREHDFACSQVLSAKGSAKPHVGDLSEDRHFQPSQESVAIVFTNQFDAVLNRCVLLIEQNLLREPMMNEPVASDVSATPRRARCRALAHPRRLDHCWIRYSASSEPVSADVDWAKH